MQFDNIDSNLKASYQSFTRLLTREKNLAF